MSDLTPVFYPVQRINFPRSIQKDPNQDPHIQIELNFANPDNPWPLSDELNDFIYFDVTAFLTNLDQSSKLSQSVEFNLAQAINQGYVQINTSENKQHPHRFSKIIITPKFFKQINYQPDLKLLFEFKNILFTESVDLDHLDPNHFYEGTNSELISQLLEPNHPDPKTILANFSSKIL